MSGKETTDDYQGPDNNEFYAEDEGDNYQTFDDLEDDEFEENEIQGTTSDDDMDDYDDEGNKIVEKPAKKTSKKEDKKKARGQKGDDMEALDLEDDEDETQIRNIDKEEDEDDEEDEDESDEKEDKEDDDKESKKPEEKLGDKKPKGKPTYVTIDGETFALDSNSEVAVPVDGKVTKVPLQELKNNYAGKVAWDKKFNEVNLKEQSVKKSTEELEQKISKFTGVKQKIEEIITNVEKNPKDALKIFLDAFEVDSYDLEERMFKADLTELANVLNMEPAERKAYFLEKKNSHLLQQSQKRKAQELEDQKRNSYRQKADALRKSQGVSEAQYVDAYEELISFGHEDKDLSEKTIVEWAATKPHRDSVKSLIEPYKDQFSEDAYGELSWKLVKILQSGTESPDTIKKHLAEVYGVPTQVKELSKKLTPIGRKKAPVKATPKKHVYESFDDLEEDDE